MPKGSFKKGYFYMYTNERIASATVGPLGKISRPITIQAANLICFRYFRCDSLL